MNLLLSQLLWGFVQGITEFLPVSSSAHLVFLSVLLPVPFGLPRLYFFTVLHFGTLMALLFYFRSLIIHYLRAMVVNKDERLFVAKLFLACVVTGLLALKLDSWADLLSGNVRIVAGNLFAMGLLLFSTRFLHEGKRSMQRITLGEAVVLGLVQAIAVFPGISRSGITIVFLLMRGFKSKDAFELSFLVGIPVIFLAFIYEAIKVHEMMLEHIVIAMLVSFLTGILALNLLKGTVLAKKLWCFGLYCWIVSILVCSFLTSFVGG